MQSIALLCTLHALLRGVAALRNKQNPQPVNTKLNTTKYRQVMDNYVDMQYFGNFTIGGQLITGILDTGSFELVVFDKACRGCGRAGKYSREMSKTYRGGKVSQRLGYGSGDVDVLEAQDAVAIGPYKEVNLTFWDSTDADMPVLNNAYFNAIVGVGPPETPGFDAWSMVADRMRRMKEDIANGYFPWAEQLEDAQKRTQLATLLGTHDTLVRAENVSHFSICLGQTPHSEGYFIWGDTSYLETPDLFTRIAVLGRHTWTVNMTSLQLRDAGRDSKVLGCGTGCGAIIDSGTSLILMPYTAITDLREALRGMVIDCNDISTLPKLAFRLDDKEFVLPPDAYISKTGHDYGTTSTFQSERVSLGFGGKDCELAVMGSSSYTNWGPLWILGMPFFRTYYTSFKFGRNHDERAIYVARASSNCTPTTMDGGSFVGRRDHEQQGLRTVNRSAMLVPRIVHKALTQPILNDL